MKIEPIFYASCTNSGILHVHLVMIVVNCQLCPVTQLQFFQNAAEIIPNCSLAETECRSDFLVAVSLCNLCNDFLFFLCNVIFGIVERGFLFELFGETGNDLLPEYVLPLHDCFESRNDSGEVLF